MAKLTDFQVEQLYLEPQAEAIRRESGKPAMPTKPPPAGEPEFPNRETYLGFTRQTFGWSAERAGTEWDRMKAEYDRQRGKT